MISFSESGQRAPSVARQVAEVANCLAAAYALLGSLPYNPDTERIVTQVMDALFDATARLDQIAVDHSKDGRQMLEG